jgi:hypothetical protein
MQATSLHGALGAVEDHPSTRLLWSMSHRTSIATNTLAWTAKPSPARQDQAGLAAVAGACGAAGGTDERRTPCAGGGADLDFLRAGRGGRAEARAADHWLRRAATRGPRRPMRGSVADQPSGEGGEDRGDDREPWALRDLQMQSWSCSVGLLTGRPPQATAGAYTQ